MNRFYQNSHWIIGCLGIIAAIVGITLNPENWKSTDDPEGLIGYFYCTNLQSEVIHEYALKMDEPDKFSVYGYHSRTALYANEPEPSVFDDLHLKNTYGHFSDETAFMWELKVGKNRWQYTLTRNTGTLYVRSYSRGTFLKDETFQCSFGKDGKKKFWSRIKEKYEFEQPKF